MPYEELMHKMMLSFSKNEYMSSILDDFYLPLFESGHINELHFFARLAIFPRGYLGA